MHVGRPTYPDRWRIRATDSSPAPLLGAGGRPSPTAMPTFALRSDTVRDLGIVLYGVVLPMTKESIATFESTYALHCTDFFNVDLEQVSKDVWYFSTTIAYVGDEALSRRRLRMVVRSVQETGTGSVLIKYNQALEYRADPEVIDLTKVVEAPFMTKGRRRTLSDLLVASGDPAYKNLQGVGMLVRPGEAHTDPQAKFNPDDIISLVETYALPSFPIIIGVCVGIGIVLLLVGGYMLYKRQSRKSSSKSNNVGDDNTT